MAAVVVSGLIAPGQTLSEIRPAGEDRIGLELSMMGKRGAAIAKARGLVLEILQNGSGCSLWFQEADPDSAGVFRSLHYAVEENDLPFVYSGKDEKGDRWFKHPWAAKTLQNSGRNSFIRLNPNGAFFKSASQIMYVDLERNWIQPGGTERLTIGSYIGDSTEAQIVTLLHELGHIVGRLPEDGDSWDGRSSQNTSEVIRHCKRGIRVVVRETSSRPTGRGCFEEAPALQRIDEGTWREVVSSEKSRGNCQPVER